MSQNRKLENRLLRGAATGLAVGFVVGLAVGVGDGPAIGLAVGLAVGGLVGILVNVLDSSDEESKRLYLARFEQEVGTIILRDAGERRVHLSGEFVVAGRRSQRQTLIIEELSLVSMGSNESLEELQGRTWLAGPANEIQLQLGPCGDGQIEPFNMWLYYPRLNNLGPAHKSNSAVFPHLETLQGRLTWELEDVLSEEAVQMRVTITLDKLVDPRIGAIETLTFGPSNVSFQLVEEQQDIVLQTMPTPLVTCTDSAPAGTSHIQKQLKVRFINLSNVVTDPKPLAQDLIAGACEVWWLKGGIKIVPQPNIVSASAPSSPCPDGSSEFCVSVADEATLFGTSSDPNAVEIYLVDQLIGDPLNPRSGGGVAHNCRVNTAYVILEIGKAQNNKYLLAHELGNVLGLDDTSLLTPVGCSSIRVGSECSVMVPHSPNSPRNTEHNLNMALCPSPMWPVFTSLLVSCGRNVDLEEDFFYTIRYAPYDDGTERPPPPTVPVAIQETHSDVWCYNHPPHAILPNKYADGNDMFNLDYSPVHTDPILTPPGEDPNNFMYVRLHTCQFLTQPVEVYFYLAAPGKALYFLGSPDFFFFTPQPGLPSANFIPWRIEDTPLTYHDSQAWVFAVAVSDVDEPPATSAIRELIDHPELHNFDDLFNFTQSTNNVAQRKLTIPPTSMPT